MSARKKTKIRAIGLSLVSILICIMLLRLRSRLNTSKEPQPNARTSQSIGAEAETSPLVARPKESAPPSHLVNEGEKPENFSFELITSDEQLEASLKRVRFDLKTEVTGKQKERMQMTLIDYLRVNRDYDVEGCLNFFKKRQMRVSQQRATLLREGAQTFVRSQGATTKIPDDPIEQWRFEKNSGFFQEIFSARGIAPDEAKKWAEALTTNRVPKALATKKSFITLADHREELPAIALRHKEPFVGPNGGDTTTVIYLFVPSPSPEELIRRGHRVIWGEASLLLRNKVGSVVPHSLIFFWNEVLEDWIPEENIVHDVSPVGLLG